MVEDAQRRALGTEEEEEPLGDGGGCAAYTEGPPQEYFRDEGAYLQGLALAQSHQLLFEVYGYRLHHNNG